MKHITLSDIRWKVARKVVASMLLCLPFVGARAAGESGSSLTPITVIYFTGSSEGFLVNVMTEQHFFEKNGLMPSFAKATSGPAITSALASGSVQFAPGYPALYLPALKQNRDLIVASPFVQPGFYNIIAQASFDIKNPGIGLTEEAKANLKLLLGHQVGVTALGAQTQVTAQLLATKAGLDWHKITFIPTGGASTAIASFLNKQIDFLVTWPPEDGILASRKAAYKTVVNSATSEENQFENLINNTWMANGEFVRTHPKAALGLCRAAIEASTFIANPMNKDAVLAIMKKYQGITQDEAEYEYGKWRWEWAPSQANYLSKARWDAQSRYLVGTSIAGYVPDYEKYVNKDCMELGRQAIKAAR
ncbi:MAG: ABC transporter substrate-binding protein [Burkholderiales bacterium]|nr:ABC transporter substrate-binding protein [Burkholderiales bacterium]